MRREASSNSRITWRSRERGLLGMEMVDLKRIVERTRERIVKGIAERIAERIAEGIAEGIAKSLECLLAWKPEHGEVGSSKVRKVESSKVRKVESSKVRNVQNGVRLRAKC
jgi:hypothetical protein